MILISCDEAAQSNVYFDQPQPVGIKSLSTFPTRLEGSYISADQASVLQVSDKSITRTFNFDIKGHKDSFADLYFLRGDTMIDRETGKNFIINIKGDSIFKHIQFTDTLFTISPRNIIKRFKGYYFLSTMSDTAYWSVKRLSLQKGKLAIGQIIDSADIAKLDVLIDASDDTLSSSYHLSRKQFKTILKQEVFSDGETFVRIKKK